MRVEIVIFDGFDELDAIAPFEVLGTAGSSGADIRVELVTAAPAETVLAAHGLCVSTRATLGRDQPPDVLIVPGGGWNDRAPQGVRAEVERGLIPAGITRLYEAGTLIAGVCTGAMLIAATGLLQGRRATTHRLALADLQAAGAEVVVARVVDDGDIVTAGGVTSGLDLALWLLERCCDPVCAQAVEQEMEYERRGTVWRAA